MDLREQSDLGPYYLQYMYKLPDEMSRSWMAKG